MAAGPIHQPGEAASLGGPFMPVNFGRVPFCWENAGPGRYAPVPPVGGVPKGPLCPTLGLSATVVYYRFLVFAPCPLTPTRLAHTIYPLSLGLP